MNRRTILVLAVAGAMGFFLGLVRGPVWQDAIEPAQVLAGLVSYPPDNPIYLYSTRTWTLLHQVSALLLAGGLTERTVALLLSGGMGMLSFQAIGLVVLALSEDAWFASVAPFFVYAVVPPGEGVGYPVFFFGAPFTYGIVGLALSVMVLGCFGAGETRAGALLLGVLPAVHVVLGVWTAVVVVLAIGLDLRSWRPLLGTAGRWLAVGALLTVLSAGWHLSTAAPRLDVDPAEARRYFDALLNHWDVHRRAVGWASDVLLMNYTTILLALVGWWRLRVTLSGPARFTLTAMAGAALVGAVFSAAALFLPSQAPPLLQAAMPTRLLNLSVFAGLAVIVGLAARYRASLWCQGLLATLVVIFTLTRPADTPVEIIDPSGTMRAAAIGLVLWALVPAARRARPPGALTRRALPVFRVAAVAAPVILFVVVGAEAVRAYPALVASRLADRTNDPFFAVAASRPGMLLTGSHVHRMQLVTRRPVLFPGGAIDVLAYVPEAGPSMERIAREVYGLTLLEPQWTGERREAYLPDDAGRALWEGRTVDDWREVAGRFGVTDIITFSDWQLQLPRVRTGAGLTLWTIP